MLILTELRQGDPLSTILFNAVLEKIIREINIGPQESVRLQDTAV